MNYWDSKKQERLLIALFILIVFVLPLFMFIFGNTALQFITVIVAICILVLMWVVHRKSVNEDKARGICKGRNKVWSMRVSGVLLCLFGVYNIYTARERLSITDPFDWLWVLLAVFFIFRGVICFGVASEYDKTIDRVEELEADLLGFGFEFDRLGKPRRKNDDEE